MIKIGITGQNGFIGTHLYHTIGLYPSQYRRIQFRREFFLSDSTLDGFVSQCDVIVHLAAMNRHQSNDVIYKTNIDLVNKLVASLRRTRSKAHVLFSSSLQEERDNSYGRSKKEGRMLLDKWVSEGNGKFSGLIIPNVFGPFGLPDHNSFIATFCYRLTHGGVPEVNEDGYVKLIYVSDLVVEILKRISNYRTEPSYFVVPHTIEVRVSEVLAKLEGYDNAYIKKGEIPVLNSNFDRNLFNTFRSYIDHRDYFPVKYKQHVDNRGTFVEIIRLGIGGQISFSTTKPGIMRGNHYHTRKIERFSVIKGKALIRLRRIGTDEILSFELDGNEPSYVDMPIWYTHNIQNIGNEMLYTNFWISEPYDPDDADTYFETV